MFELAVGESAHELKKLYELEFGVLFVTSRLYHDGLFAHSEAEAHVHFTDAAR